MLVRQRNWGAGKTRGKGDVVSAATVSRREPGPESAPPLTIGLSICQAHAGLRKLTFPMGWCRTNLQHSHFLGQSLRQGVRLTIQFIQPSGNGIQFALVAGLLE